MKKTMIGCAALMFLMGGSMAQGVQVISFDYTDLDGDFVADGGVTAGKPRG